MYGNVCVTNTNCEHKSRLRRDFVFRGKPENKNPKSETAGPLYAAVSDFGFPYSDLCLLLNIDDLFLLHHFLWSSSAIATITGRFGSLQFLMLLKAVE